MYKSGSSIQSVKATSLTSEEALLLFFGSRKNPKRLNLEEFLQSDFVSNNISLCKIQDSDGDTYVDACSGNIVSLYTSGVLTAYFSSVISNMQSASGFNSYYVGVSSSTSKAELFAQDLVSKFSAEATIAQVALIYNGVNRVLVTNTKTELTGLDVNILPTNNLKIDDGNIGSGPVNGHVLTLADSTNGRATWQEISGTIKVSSDDTTLNYLSNKLLIASGSTGLSSTLTNPGGNETLVLENTLPNDSLAWIFSTITTKADPGSGRIRFNNADPSLVTEIYIDDLPNSAVDMGRVIGSMKYGDLLYFEDQSDPANNSHVFEVQEIPVDETGYWTLVVSRVSGGSLPTDGKNLLMRFLNTNENIHRYVPQIGAAAANSTGYANNIRCVTYYDIDKEGIPSSYKFVYYLAAASPVVDLQVYDQTNATQLGEVTGLNVVGTTLGNAVQVTVPLSNFPVTGEIRIEIRLKTASTNNTMISLGAYLTD